MQSVPANDTSVSELKHNINTCDPCRNLLTTALAAQEPSATGHHRTPADFLAAVRQNCDLCSRLWSTLSYEMMVAVDNYGDSWQHEECFTTGITYEHTRLVEGSKTAGTFSIHIAFARVAWLSLPRRTVSDQAHLWLTALPSSSLDQSMLASPTGNRTSCDAAWHTAMQWYQQCLTMHPSCGQNVSDVQHPTRLLDVEKLDDGIVTLIDTTVTQIDGPYTTLSHLWGREPFLRLSVDNIDAMKAGYSVSELRKGFQDALWVTKKLGVRYLWIDSLCIIQDGDDYADWKIEAKSMHHYYSNAVCNISATAAWYGSEGLFRRRDHKNMLHMCFEASDQLYNIIDVTLWSRHLERAPLHRRAWVMQERLLSKRILHFGKGQLLWECAQSTCAEMYPKGMPAVSTLQRSAYLKDFDVNSTDVQQLFPGCSGKNLSRSLWARLVNYYSSCSMTYLSDKVPAFHGIKTAFEERFNDQCVHGLWNSTFVSDLLWLATSPSERLDDEHRLNELPSWSWLSNDTPVELPRYDSERTTVAKVLSMPGNDKEHTIKLSGPTTLVNTLYRRKPDGPVELAMPDLVRLAARKINPDSYTGIFLDGRLDTLDKSEITEVWPMYLAVSAKVTDSHRKLHVEGLILRKINKATDLMRRVGKIEVICGPVGIEAGVEAFADLLEVLQGHDQVIELS